MMSRKVTIVVVSAPSGGGKDTIIGKVLERDKEIVHSVSATTRQPRNNEKNGIHYWFMDVDEFMENVDKEAFIEWAEVHGHLYGTLHSEVDKQLNQGLDVVLELDIKGKRSVKEAEPNVKTIFIEPPSLEVLEQRIRDRGGLKDHEIKTRLRNAEFELQAKDEYDYIILNDILEDAVNDFRRILEELRNNGS
jgi:guanylate kinase